MTKKKAPQSPYFRFIEEQYQMEIEDEHRESMQRTVSFNFPAEDACMLAAIAKRFGKSTAALGGELYADSVRQLFCALSAEDRQRLAAEADAELTRYAESKGITCTTNGEPGYQHWRMYAGLCDKVDAEGQGDE